MAKSKTEKVSLKRELTGLVSKVSDSKSFTIRVEQKFRHPKYGKIVKTHKKFAIHNPESKELTAGQSVTVIESKPISKTKKWLLKTIND